MDTRTISSQNCSVKGEDLGNGHFPILPLQMQFSGYSDIQCALLLTRTPVLRGTLSMEGFTCPASAESTGQLQAWCKEFHTCVPNE